MTNQEILSQLIFERDAVFRHLSSAPLSSFFDREYESILSGETFIMSDDRDDMLNNLQELRNNKTYNAAFADKVNSINSIDEQQIIKKFTQDWKMAFERVSLKALNTEIHAALVMYDAYDLPAQNSLGLYGLNEYPALPVPQYLPSTFYEKGINDLQDVLDFTQAWPDCEEFDWTTEHIDVYFELQKLFKLNSRILLHKAIAVMYQNGNLVMLKKRPFYFYIAEHDMEASMLYKVS